MATKTTATTTSQPQQHSGDPQATLMGVPAEVRTIILRYLLIKKPPLSTIPYEARTPDPYANNDDEDDGTIITAWFVALFPILHICSQLRREGYDILLLENVFAFDLGTKRGSRRMAAFLEKFMAGNTTRLRRIIIMPEYDKRVTIVLSLQAGESVAVGVKEEELRSSLGEVMRWTASSTEDSYFAVGLEHWVRTLIKNEGYTVEQDEWLSIYEKVRLMLG